MKLFIATSNFLLSNFEIEKILKKKIIIKRNPKKRTLSEKEIAFYAKDSDLIIAGTEKYTFDVLKKLKNLKKISRCGTGTDNINMSFVKKKNILVKKVQNYHALPVSEYILASLLNIIRQISIFNSNLKNKKWKKVFTNTLYHKKIAFIGFGKIAKALKKLLYPFKVKLKYLDIKENYKNKDLVKCFIENDIIIISISGITKNFINKKVLNRANKKIILLNVSRGENINEIDLINFLKKNKKAFFISDVFSKEPYSGKLINLKNTFLTPHIANYTRKFRSLMEIESIKNLK